MAERAAHLVDHALVLDGLFAKDGAGAVRFHPAPRLTRDEVAAVEWRIVRLLERRGLADGDESSGTADAWAEEAPALARIAAASVQGLVAIGPLAGAPIRPGGDSPEELEAPALGRRQARQHAFDLHAGIVAPAGDREHLEACAGTRCGRQWPRTGCARPSRRRCSCSFATDGRTGRRTFSSSNCWSASRH